MRSATGPRILVVGYHAFDVTVPLRDWPRPDAKHEVDAIRIGGGGPGATAAVALARLGANVSLLSPLTDDLPGQLQVRELRSAGVDISRCPVRNGYRSPKAVILVDPEREERTIFWSRGDLPHLAPEEVDPGWVDGLDLLYTDGHEPVVSCLLGTAARKRGLPVVMDAGSVRSGSRELVASCSDVISSRGFAPDLTGCEDPREALERLRTFGPENVAMTFGNEGVLALDKGCPVTVPAFGVSVVDTTGAGDAFHAGYAFARAQGRAFVESLEFGSAVAALKCRGWQGRSTLPDLAEVDLLLKMGERRPLGPGLRDFE